MQVVSRIAAGKRKHRISNKELGFWLSLLGAILPPGHRLPRTFYMLRKQLRQPLQDTPELDSMPVRHMCPDKDCDHIYPHYPGTSSDLCPVAGCQRERFRYGHAVLGHTAGHTAGYAVLH